MEGIRKLRAEIKMKINLEISAHISFHKDNFEKVINILKNEGFNYSVCDETNIKLFTKDDKSFQQMLNFLNNRSKHLYFKRSSLAKKYPKLEIKASMGNASIELNNLDGLMKDYDSTLKRLKIKNVDYFFLSDLSLDKYDHYINVVIFMKNEALLFYKEKGKVYLLDYCYIEKNDFYKCMENIIRQEIFFQECL